MREQCPFTDCKVFKEEELTAIFEKTQAKVGDTLVFVADKDSVVFDALGALRCNLQSGSA